MIIVHLNGGLGNQMFQYAFGKRTAENNNDILKLDLSHYSNTHPTETPRRYNLDIYNINESFASDKEIGALKFGNRSFFSRILSWLSVSDEERSYIVEKFFQFDQSMLDIKGNAYLQGYWQSEKYFNDIRKVLLENFTIKTHLDDKNKKVLDGINETESVSVHIRRGDYIKDKKTKQFHGTCSLEYYKKAIDIIGKKIKNPHFFIFSDDIEWAKKNLRLSYPAHFVDNNDDEHNYEDLRLMSNCKHNIIANSSFSWWGAWLNQNPDKIVIAPRKWFNDPNIDTSDVTPKSWLRI